ncbi:MAG: BolA family protein [Sandaracinaceae bacterium]
MIEPETVVARIRDGVPGCQEVQLEDLTGTKDHYRAVIVSPHFEGKTRVEQHQAVYAALGELIQGASAPVHALSLATYTPARWAEQQAEQG